MSQSQGEAATHNIPREADTSAKIKCDTHRWLKQVTLEDPEHRSYTMDDVIRLLLYETGRIDDHQVPHYMRE